jgi:hypothetical protein
MGSRPNIAYNSKIRQVSYSSRLSVTENIEKYTIT